MCVCVYVSCSRLSCFVSFYLILPRPVSPCPVLSCLVLFVSFWFVLSRFASFGLLMSRLSVISRIAWFGLALLRFVFFLVSFSHLVSFCLGFLDEYFDSFSSVLCCRVLRAVGSFVVSTVFVSKLCFCDFSSDLS